MKKPTFDINYDSPVNLDASLRLSINTALISNKSSSSDDSEPDPEPNQNDLPK